LELGFVGEEDRKWDGPRGQVRALRDITNRGSDSEAGEWVVVVSLERRLGRLRISLTEIPHRAIEDEIRETVLEVVLQSTERQRDPDSPEGAVQCSQKLPRGVHLPLGVARHGTWERDCHEAVQRQEFDGCPKSGLVPDHEPDLATRLGGFDVAGSRF
jgi:hypothetical protein